MWWMIANTVVASAIGTRQQKIASCGADRVTHDFERQVREHQARIAADTRKTMRQAMVGTGLLIALVVTAAYGIAQLLGVVP